MDSRKLSQAFSPLRIRIFDEMALLHLKSQQITVMLPAAKNYRIVVQQEHKWWTKWKFF